MNAVSAVYQDTIRKKKKSSTFLGFFLLLSFWYMLANFWEPLRFLKYITLLPSLLIILHMLIKSRRDLILEGSAAKIFFALSGYAFCTYLIVGGTLVLIDLLIYLCIALFALASRNCYFSIEKAFYMLGLVFIFWVVGQIQKHGLAAVLNYQGASLSSSSESKLKYATVCYAFSLFAIYFLWTNNRKLIFLALIGVVLTSKRAAFIALLFVLLLYYSPKYLRDLVFTRSFGLILNSAWLACCVFIASDAFYTFTQDYFNANASALTLGRNVLYRAGLETFSPTSFLFGSGIASTYSHLAIHPSLIELGLDKILIHNEVLRIFIEGGVGLLFVIIWFLYSPSSGAQNSDPAYRGMLMSCVLFINVVAFFDNLFVYTLVWYVFIIIAGGGKLRSRYFSGVG